MVRRWYIKFLSLGIAFSSWMLHKFQRAMAYQALSVFADLVDGESHIILLDDNCQLDDAYAKIEEFHTRDSLKTWQNRATKVPDFDS